MNNITDELAKLHELFEVMIFKRNKVIQVKRVSVENHDFIKKFILFYHK